MRRRLPMFLESAVPALVLAVVILVGGMGYGFYQAHQTPVEGAVAVPAAPAN
jgi:hypothetical protein